MRWDRAGASGMAKNERGVPGCCYRRVDDSGLTSVPHAVGGAGWTKVLGLE